MQYEHVHEKFRHLVTADNQERIAFLDEPRWLGYGVAKDIMDNLVSLMNKPKRPRMLNLLIVGDSNNGKTTLIRRFFDLYGQAYIDSDSNAIYPILLAEAPPSVWGTDLFCIERKKKIWAENNGEPREYKGSPLLFGWSYAKNKMSRIRKNEQFLRYFLHRFDRF